jgi:hypothetical protein
MKFLVRHKSEIRDQGSEVRGQRSEVRDQESVVGAAKEVSAVGIQESIMILLTFNF